MMCTHTTLICFTKISAPTYSVLTQDLVSQLNEVAFTLIYLGECLNDTKHIQNWLCNDTWDSRAANVVDYNGWKYLREPLCLGAE